MDHEKPTGPIRNLPTSASEGELAPNPAVDDFFRRLKQDLHPKPGTEAIAAALQAVQRLASQVDADGSAGTIAESLESRTCLSCGSQNPADNRFCAICGVPLADAPPQELNPSIAPSAKPAAQAAGQHHYHHHYHHHYLASPEGGVPLVGSEPRASSGAPVARDARARSAPGGLSLSRGEAAVRKLTQDWAQACNSKQLDDLVELYGADAIVLRRSRASARRSLRRHCLRSRTLQDAGSLYHGQTPRRTRQVSVDSSATGGRLEDPRRLLVQRFEFRSQPGLSRSQAQCPEPAQSRLQTPAQRCVGSAPSHCAMQTKWEGMA
jgi:hypothetical protein